MPFLYYLSSVQSLSCVWLFATPWTVARQAPLLWDFPGKNTGVGYHFFLQGIFQTQRSNMCLLHWQVDSLPLSHLESPQHMLDCPHHGCEHLVRRDHASLTFPQAQHAKCITYVISANFWRNLEGRTLKRFRNTSMLHS